MNEPPISDLNLPDLAFKPSLKQENNGSMGGGQQSSVGSQNIQNQGDNIHVTVINHSSESQKNDLAENQSSPCLNQTQGKPIGEKIFDDHKYGGNLVTILLELYEVAPSEKVRVMLSLSFGKPEVKIPNSNRLLNRTKNVDIKFGIKNGELCLDLKNGVMPLNQRESLESQKNNWKGNPIGNPPRWEFELRDKSNFQGELEVLFGCIKDREMGIINLLEPSNCCEVTVFFKIGVNRNCIEIVSLDDGTNKKQKETKIGLLLQYLKAELENYVSKVAIKYDPATIP